MKATWTALLALLPLSCRPAAAPVLTAVELRVFDDMPDAYELVSFEIRIDGETVDRPTDPLRRDHRYTWRGKLDLTHTRKAEAIAVFRDGTTNRTMKGAHNLDGPLGGTIVFYEKRSQGMASLETSRFRPPLTSETCAHPGSGPPAQYTIKLGDRTTTKYRVEAIHVELDAHSVIEDEGAVVVGLAAKKMPILAMKVAEGCHVLSARATLVAGEKKYVLEQRRALRAREGAAVTVTFNEGAADVLDVLFVPEN